MEDRARVFKFEKALEGVDNVYYLNLISGDVLEDQNLRSPFYVNERDDWESETIFRTRIQIGSEFDSKMPLKFIKTPDETFTIVDPIAGHNNSEYVRNGFWLGSSYRCGL